VKRSLHEQAELDAELEGVRAEFRSTSHDVDEHSAVQHLKAVLVCAASGKPTTEARYLAALEAVSSEEARRSDSGDVAEHVRTAEILSDAAEARLAKRGIFWSSADYERLYVDEIVAVSKETGLEYRAV
jgi:hypothetical protein